MARVVRAVVNFLGLRKARPVQKHEPENGCAQAPYCFRRSTGRLPARPAFFLQMANDDMRRPFFKNRWIAVTNQC